MRRSRLHAVTLLVWAVAATATVELAPNPLYVLVVIAIAALLVETQAGSTPFARAFPILVGLSAAFVLFRLVLAALTTHGIGPEVFTLPSVTLPKLVGGFAVGGTVEVPVVLQALADGIVVVGVVAAFAAFNATASHYELVQTAPRAFYEPGLVVVVALAFVPSTITAVRDVREADRARTGGVRVRRGRILRSVLPVLETGMERALRLAESMDARGFGRHRDNRAQTAAGWLAAAALVALAASFLALVAQARTPALTSALLAVVCLAGAVVAASRATRRSRHRPRRFTPLDVAVTAAVLAAPLGLALFGLAGKGSLVWSPTPPAAPGFDPLVAITLLLLAAPALVPTTRTGDAAAVPVSLRRLSEEAT